MDRTLGAIIVAHSSWMILPKSKTTFTCSTFPGHFPSLNEMMIYSNLDRNLKQMFEKKMELIKTNTTVTNQSIKKPQQITHGNNGLVL